MKANLDIRTIIKKSNCYTWQIAQKLGIHENTFYRWMRTEMPPEKKEMVIEAISKIEKGSVVNE